jgi:hypothetical protein
LTGLGDLFSFFTWGLGDLPLFGLLDRSLRRSKLGDRFSFFTCGLGDLSRRRSCLSTDRPPLLRSPLADRLLLPVWSLRLSVLGDLISFLTCGLCDSRRILSPPVRRLFASPSSESLELDRFFFFFLSFFAFLAFFSLSPPSIFFSFFSSFFFSSLVMLFRSWALKKTAD